MDEPLNQADARFMDAVLEHNYSASEARVSGLVGEALRRAQLESSLRRRRSVTRWWAGGVSFAAAALVMVGIFLWSSSAAQAMKVIERSIASLSEAGDRHYAWKLDADLPGSRERFEGDLFMRGTGEIAIRSVQEAGTFWAGDDGSESWVIPPYPQLPVLVTRSGALRDILMRWEDKTSPLLDLKTGLKRLREGYELELRSTRDGSLEVSAVRSAKPIPGWPKSVVFEADETGVVTRLEARFAGVLGSRHITLEFLDSEPILDATFRHRTHHEMRRVVERR